MKDEIYNANLSEPFLGLNDMWYLQILLSAIIIILENLKKTLMSESTTYIACGKKKIMYYNNVCLRKF